MHNFINIDFVSFKVVNFELSDFENYKHENINYDFNIDFIPNIEKEIVAVDLSLVGFEKKENSLASFSIRSIAEFKIPANYFETDLTKLDDIILTSLFSKSYSLVTGYLISKMEGTSWTQEDLPKIDEISVVNHFKSNRYRAKFPLGEEIISLLEKNKVKEAIAILEQEIRKQESTPAYLLLGTIYSDIIDNQDKAIYAFKKALDLDKSEVKINENIGNCYFNKNDYKQAILYYSKVIAVTPSDTKPRLSRGTCFYYIGNFQRAIDDLTICLEFDTSDYTTWCFLASAYLKSGKDNESVEICHQAIKLNIFEGLNLGMIYNELGFVYLVSGQLEKAKIALLKAVELGINNLGYSNLGHVFLLEGNEKSALNAYSKSYEAFVNKEDFWKLYESDFEILQKHGITKTAFSKMKQSIKKAVEKK